MCGMRMARRRSSASTSACRPRGHSSSKLLVVDAGEENEPLNTPPTEFIRVMPEPLHAFVTALFEKVGMSAEDAGFIARQLVATDLRGVFSHGTRQTPGYVQMIHEGKVNPRPKVRVESDG